MSHNIGTHCINLQLMADMWGSSSSNPAPPTYASPLEGDYVTVRTYTPSPEGRKYYGESFTALFVQNKNTYTLHTKDQILICDNVIFIFEHNSVIFTHNYKHYYVEFG